MTIQQAFESVTDASGDFVRAGERAGIDDLPAALAQDWTVGVAPVVQGPKRVSSRLEQLVRFGVSGC